MPIVIIQRSVFSSITRANHFLYFYSFLCWNYFHYCQHVALGETDLKIVCISVERMANFRGNRFSKYASPDVAFTFSRQTYLSIISL